MIRDISQDFLIALGANQPSDLGSPLVTLQAAIAALAEQGVVIRKISKFYETPCFPVGAGPDYVNAALHVSAAMTPRRMLDILHDVEARFGRLRTQRWASRTVDMDLLACGQIVLPSAEMQDQWRSLSLEAQQKAVPGDLILPHPRIQDRSFVLVPLADVAPDWVHPRTGKTVRQMLDALPQEDVSTVRPI